MATAREHGPFPSPGPLSLRLRLKREATSVFSSILAFQAEGSTNQCAWPLFVASLALVPEGRFHRFGFHRFDMVLTSSPLHVCGFAWRWYVFVSAALLVFHKQPVFRLYLPTRSLHYLPPRPLHALSLPRTWAAASLRWFTNMRPYAFNCLTKPLFGYS